MPLDTSDGNVVGVMLATGAGAHISLLPVAARLLSYEWESISTRAELRRLGEIARDRECTDAVTGLPNRASLLEALEREWELGKRGTVLSYLVVCRIAGRDALRDRQGNASADLLLKDVAEALGGVRPTDYLARVDDDLLATVLVGFKDMAGALAFVARCERALSASPRPACPIELAYSYRALAETTSAEDALVEGEADARQAEARPVGAAEITGEAA